MHTLSIKRPAAVTKVLVAAALVLTSVAMTAKAADAADLGNNVSFNTYGNVLEVVDHNINTVVSLDQTKAPAGRYNPRIFWGNKTAAQELTNQSAQTSAIVRRVRDLTGWNLWDAGQRNRVIAEASVVSRALDNELRRGNRGQLNLPQEKKMANAIFSVTRQQGTHTDCRGRCLKYTYRSVMLGTTLAVLGATAGAGLLGASTPIILTVTLVASVLAVFINAVVMFKASEAAERDERRDREKAFMQNVVNNFLLQGINQLGNQQGAMQNQLEDMGAQINRVEAGVTANAQANMLP